MTQTVTGTVAVRQKQDQLVDWVRGQQDEIAMVAATHVKPSSVVRVVHGALRRNPKLMAAAIANPTSLLSAMLDAARLGHEPDTDDYYLVPFGSEVQGIEGYKGIIERMYRAGGVTSVVAQVVRQRDDYASRGQNTPPHHEYDDFASPEQRGPMRGAYAYAILPGGQCSQVIRMGRDEIMEHKAKNRGSDKPDSPWLNWESAMWKKTVLRALEPYVPTSTEYRTAAAAQPASIARIDPQLGQARPAVAAPADIVDGVIVDDQAPARARDGAAETEAPAQTRSSAAPPKPPTKQATQRLGDLLRQIPLGSEEDAGVLITWLTGLDDLSEPLSADDVAKVTTYLDDHLKAAKGNGEDAASAIWTEHKQATS